MINLHWCRWSLLGLVLLQPFWFVYWHPPGGWATLVITVIATGPLLLLLPGCWRSNGRSLVMAGTLLMLYFSFGVMETWSSPPSRLPAILQTALTTAFFMGLATIRRAPARSD